MLLSAADELGTHLRIESLLAATGVQAVIVLVCVAAAVGVAAGGNVDVTLLSVIIEKGLIKSNRKIKLTVTLVDKPGSLMQLTGLLRDLNANIVHIAYDRTSTDLDYGDANVTIHLETKGKEHQSEIIKVLHDNGYLSNEFH